MTRYKWIKVATTLFCISAFIYPSWSAVNVVAKPRPQIFASASGQTFLRIVPIQKGTVAAGVLTVFTDKGKEKVLWNKPLLRFPTKAFVSEQMAGGAYVVAYDPQGIVIYDLQGKVLQDFRPSGTVGFRMFSNPIQDSEVFDFAKLTQALSGSGLCRFEGNETAPAFVAQTMPFPVTEWYSESGRGRVTNEVYGSDALIFDLKTGKAQAKYHPAVTPFNDDARKAMENIPDPFVGRYRKATPQTPAVRNFRGGGLPTLGLPRQENLQYEYCEIKKQGNDYKISYFRNAIKDAEEGTGEVFTRVPHINSLFGALVDNGGKTVLVNPMICVDCHAFIREAILSTPLGQFIRVER